MRSLPPNKAADNKMEIRGAEGQTKAAVFFIPRDWGAPADEGSDKAKVACRAGGGRRDL